MPPPGRGRTTRRLSPRRRSSTAPVRLSSTKWSGLTDPLTTASPRPGLASTTVSAAPSRHRVDGEHHPGHRGVDHPLHHDGEPGLGVVDPVTDAVHDSPVGPERRPAPMDRVEDGVRPDDAQIGVLLTGEAGERKILGGRRGADGHRRFAQGPIRGGDRVRHVRGHGRGQDPVPCPPGDLRGPVRGIRGGACQLFDDPGQVRRERDVAICVRGHAEAVGDREAGPMSSPRLAALPPASDNAPASRCRSGTTNDGSRLGGRLARWTSSIAISPAVS